MTDGFDQACADAFLTLLNADPDLTVCDGIVPNGTSPPYVLMYFTISRPSDDPDNASDGRTRVWVPRGIFHCVGENAAAARAVAQRVRTALLDVTPTIPGLSCSPIRMEGDSLPPQRDESLGFPVMDAVETYRFKATS